MNSPLAVLQKGLDRAIIEDCAKDGGEEFFTEMHRVL